MDHLELPSAPTHPPVTVPYFSTIEYDGGPFATYPQRQSWSESDIYNRRHWSHRHPIDDESSLSAAGKSQDEATSFLQNWLFFGLLSTVLGPQFRANEYVYSTHGGDRFVTTENLLENVSHMIDRLRDNQSEQLKIMMGLVDRNLTIAHQVHAFICANTTLDPALLLSIAILGDFLALIRNVVYWRGDPPTDELVFNWNTGDAIQTDMLAQQMEADGWCISQIIRSKRLTPSARYFVSRLAPPSAGKPHDACSRFRCLAYQMDWSTYRTAHRADHCDCKFLAASQDRLVEILSKDKIPLITTAKLIAKGFDGEIELAENSSHIVYVAISHVWSDGMGNTQANALPRCQLQHLTSLVQQLYPSSTAPVSFWIDTICCPVKPRWARSKAITLMRQTYRDADKVLVLDNYMRKYPALDVPVFEPFARIYHCGWTQRLWTLQEGVLARSLYIQFADVAINFDSAWQSMVSGRQQQTEFHNLLTFPTRIRGDWTLTWRDINAPFISIQSAVIALHERFTSIATDEALCLGTLLGVDMERLLTVSPAERMKQFWSLFPSYSGEFAFWTGPRLSQVGFGWAPVSFMNARLEWFPGNHFSNAQNPAYLTGEGLEVRWPGFVLGKFAATELARKFWLRDESGKSRYWLSCTAGRSTPWDEPTVRISGTFSEATEIAIITRSPLPLDDNQEINDVASVLVKVQRRDNDMMYAKVIRTARIYYASPGSIPSNDLEYAALHVQLASHLKQGLSVGNASMTPNGYRYEGVLFPSKVEEYLPEGQKWCLV
ncbi:MAG: hypothetical protein Q9160_004071 [Pyrenula sp. 1 TL-2023]